MSEDAQLGEWRCSSCGETHSELPAVASSAPAIWFDSSDDERVNDFDLTTDTCVWRDEAYFVRCVLALPLIGRDETFEFGVWSSLSEENFRRYLAEFDSPSRADLGSMFGWFSTQLPGYPDTINLKCHVHPREPGLRPTLELEPTDHPLAIQQGDGISFEDAVAYVHEHMNF